MLGLLRFSTGLAGGLAGPIIGLNLMARFFPNDDVGSIFAVLVFLLGCFIVGVLASQLILFIAIFLGERIFRHR